MVLLLLWASDYFSLVPRPSVQLVSEPDPHILRVWFQDCIQYSTHTHVQVYHTEGLGRLALFFKFHN